MASISCCHLPKKTFPGYYESLPNSHPKFLFLGGGSKMSEELRADVRVRVAGSATPCSILCGAWMVEVREWVLPCRQGLEEQLQILEQNPPC